MIKSVENTAAKDLDWLRSPGGARREDDMAAMRIWTICANSNLSLCVQVNFCFEPRLNENGTLPLNTVNVAFISDEVSGV